MPTTNTQAANDAATIRRLVEQAVRAAVAPSDIVDRPIWPGSASTLETPTPAAGFKAARQVVALAEAQVHKYAVQLRGEGKSWRELADLMEIPWSDEYSRVERAFELCAGPDRGGVWSRGPTVHWHCGGPDGCGRYITDRGPYNGQPLDDEDGHAEACLRQAADVAAWERDQEDRERRWAVMDEAYGKLSGYAKETADRARYVTTHGGRWLGWSTSESLAVALVLDDEGVLKREGYGKRADAIRRVFGDPPSPRALAGISTTKAWIALVRAAATGK